MSAEAPANDAAAITVHRAADRYRTAAEGITTRHSFSYGAHYDAANVGFGPLIAVNEESIDPGQGYEQHHHADVEIVTWVLEGALLHEDTTGHSETITPGTAQRLSAGTGVTHTERNASDTKPLRFLQMMLRSTNTGDPVYAQHEVGEGAGLLETAGIQLPKARLSVARCAPGRMIHVPASEYAYVHVCSGTVSAAEYMLGPGDALRMHRSGSYDLLAGDHAEALIWRMQG